MELFAVSESPLLAVKIVMLIIIVVIFYSNLRTVCCVYSFTPPLEGMNTLCNYTMHFWVKVQGLPYDYLRYGVPTLLVRSTASSLLRDKFHYTILVADRSEAGRRPAASWNLAYHLAG